MVFTSSDVASTVLLQGPFWQADVEVVQLASPVQNLAFRNLWLERHGDAADQLYLPGTSIVLGCVRRVTVTLADDRANDRIYGWARSQTPAPPAETPTDIRNALATGELVLLLVQVDPQAWPNEFTGNPDQIPPLTCLAGDIPLEPVLNAEEQATDRLYGDLDIEAPTTETQLTTRSGATRLRSALSVHGSGLSLYGGIDLPWQSERLLAPFQLAQTFAPSASEPVELVPGPFRLTVEVERLILSERQAWIAAWQKLSQFLTPRNPLNDTIPAGAEAGPHWVTLEVTNPSTIPNLYWEIRLGEVGRTLKFPKDSFSLILSNQSPYDLDTPPTSLGKTSGTVTIAAADTADTPGAITISLETGVSSPAEHYTYQYRSGVAETVVETPEIAPSSSPQTIETVTLKELTLAFDPVAVPSFLRRSQGLPQPASESETFDAPLLWGFMPLERGWFQLPVPNLTEQVYLDNGLARDLPTRTTGLIQGAVALGNDDPDLLATDYPDEQPWNLVLTNAAYLQGTWTLSPNPTPADGYRLSQVVLNGAAPEVVINGLFWLSTSRPLAQDALPNLDNWVSGLQSHPLRTVRDTDLFPAAVEIKLDELILSARTLPPVSTSESKPVVAELGNWSFSYEVNGEVLGDLVQENILPANTFSQFLPWVWQHHGTLPMVQALPLTQTLLPPNYPSTNRQLVPFELGVKTITVADLSLAVPDGWQFSAVGAGAWPDLPPTPEPVAREWGRLFDLPLVSLSLPGLALDPQLNGDSLALDITLGVGTQYRFDLPYTDEPNALAQLPEPPQDPEAVSPLPDSPLPEPPEPLLRDTFVDHWQQLSTKASLASADAVVATNTDEGSGQIQSLVEPFTWPVLPSLDLSAYPGKLTLANQASTNDLSLKLATADEITLEGLTALEGISGKFSQNGTSFDLVAGSLMAAGDATGLRDQRGVTRSASRVETSLIKTPVSLQLEPTVLNEYDLTTTRQPLALTLGDLTWQLWFRDLPIQRLEEANPQFSRQQTQSAEAEDINDPNALGREHNLLSGYEWRLGETNLSKQEFLSFFGLHFYPLTLETLTLAGEDVQTLQLIGRLQLPLSAKGELIPDLSSDVQITFERRDRTLVLTAVAPAALEPDTASKGIWPLALENNETTNAPQVTWEQVSLQTDSGELALVFADVWLKFFLFDSAWALPLDTLVFPAGGTDEVLGRFDFPAVNPLPALDPRQANLTLRLANPDAFQHSASLQIDVHLGEMAGPTEPKPTFKATLTFSLTPSSPEPSSPESIVVWDTSSLFDQLPLVPGRLHLNHHALEFEWSQARQLEQTFQFLPGMPITTGDMPGFAALTFNPKDQAQAADDVQFPDLELATAFLETILSCQWGDSLQTTTGVTPAKKEVVVNTDGNLNPIFNASAGDVVIGYTTHWVPPVKAEQEQPGSWDASLLLNGFLEVKNLVSWPLALQTYEEAETENAPAGVVLPALPVANDNGRALSHLRHGMRVMLNQHRLPVKLLTLGPTGQVFEFGNEQPWELLAVTEHQLLSVFADSAQAYRLGEERRWTTTQAVRLMSVDVFKAFLSQSTAQTIDPTQGVSTLGQASLGLWHQNFQLPLTDPDSPFNDPDLGSMLMVEASAPHWVRTNSVVPASPTTLQVLPNGSQLGILSNPEDYGPSDPQDPHWMLLTMPFLGRLLNPTPALTESTNPIQHDPVDLLAQGHLSDLSLALTSWAETEPAFLTLAGFDTAAGRTWARLDPLSLEESWFRLNNPLPEAQPGQLQSILAALPSTPARLSRSTALDYAFDPQRLHYPPATRLSAVPASAEDSPSLLIHPEISRTAKGLQALYIFQEGDDPGLVKDVSGVDTPLDLTIADTSNTDWIDGGGLRINEATLIQADQPALKIIQSCRATNELTIEAWIQLEEGQLGQRGPARIVTLSNGASNRYFTLGHEKDQNYVVRLRVEDATDSNGLLLPDERTHPIATTPGSIEAGLTHLVFTRQANGEMRFFINGQAVASNTVPNDLFPINQERGKNRDPDQTFRFALANETTNDRPWLGEYRLVAIYNRALTSAEVSTLTEAGLTTGAQRKDRPYSWHQTALQLKTSGLFPAVEQPVEQISRRLNRHAAATLLPARLQVRGQVNPRPMSLSISPYLGLEFQPVLKSPSTIQLASVELLCLDAGSGNLRPVASTLLDKELLDASETPIEAISQQWATETHQRLTPESAIAVLRYREILSDEIQQVVTRYRFQILSVEQSEGLAKRIFALRSPVGQQRFPSGQFGGCRMPLAPETFELAVPQTVGVQPLYLNQRPAVENASPDEAENWPWGLSGLRLSVQYSDRKQPALGRAHTSDTLWWQTPSYAMQYRANDPAQPDLPTAGLPPFYRPGAIKTLLPVLPKLPMPSISTDNWQPVLPGQLRYLLTGDRPGVMMAIRNQLLKQTLDTSEPLLVSGSVPVQHRVPRPVALPPNGTSNGDRDRALQPWASYFEPERNLLATDSPADEAFFADCGDRSAQRLLLQMQAPIAGAISSDWDGTLQFLRPSNVADWNITLTLVDELQTFTYENFQSSDLRSPGIIIFNLPPADIPRLRDTLASRATGDIVTVMARVIPAGATDNFAQTLSFPLRVIDPIDLPLPLRPAFIHFEDPEYNRQLVSSAATATVSVLESRNEQESLTYDITLACDRQEYSPQSTLFLRYDWNDNREAFTGELLISRINEAGGVKPLKWPKQDNLQADGRALPINSGILQPISLVDLLAENNRQTEDNPQAKTDFILNQGDILELTLKLTVSGQTEDVVIVLSVTVVTAPVIPVPQAAYGLLRSLTATVPEETPLVECVRFAWGPAASRIELVCAEDLRTGVVRRRAVFQWSDTVRPSLTQYGYAVQKITQTGSTHLPDFRTDIRTNVSTG